MLYDGSYNVPEDMYVLGYDLMTYASQCGHIGIVRSLVLDFSWDLNRISPSGVNALYAASMANQKGMVELLLYWQADMNIFQGKDQWTPLMIASSLGHAAIVALFLNTKCDTIINAASPLTGETALYCAAANGHKSVVQMLLLGGADTSVWHRTTRGLCALDIAIKKGHQGIAALILAYAEKELWNHGKDLSYSLMMAVYYCREDISLHLLKAGARSTMIMKGGLSPLMVCALKGNIPILRYCVNHAYLHTYYDISISLFFARRKNDTCVAELLEFLIPPTKIIDDAHTLLRMAAYKDHEFWVLSLLKFAKKEVDINKQDKKQQTLLYQLAAEGKENMVKILLDFGADPLLGNNQGLTPMYKAASLNHVMTVKRFLEAGVDVNCYRHPNHLTSLFVACCAGYKEMVDLLMDAGACPFLTPKPNITFKNAYEAAQSSGNVHIAARLKVICNL